MRRTGGCHRGLPPDQHSRGPRQPSPQGWRLSVAPPCGPHRRSTVPALPGVRLGLGTGYGSYNATAFFTRRGFPHQYPHPDPQTPARPAGSIPAKDPLPWLNDGTTYRNDYTPKGLMLLPPAGYDPASPFPFDSTTEYRCAPHLTCAPAADEPTAAAASPLHALYVRA